MSCISNKNFQHSSLSLCTGTALQHRNEEKYYALQYSCVCCSRQPGREPSTSLTSETIGFFFYINKINKQAPSASATGGPANGWVAFIPNHPASLSAKSGFLASETSCGATALFGRTVAK